MNYKLICLQNKFNFNIMLVMIIKPKNVRTRQQIWVFVKTFFYTNIKTTVLVFIINYNIGIYLYYGNVH